jgi:tetratricopeptide (TPR) repeat protein
MLVSSGDRDAAIIAYRHASEIAPDSPLILARYLSLLTDAKRFPEAKTVLQSRLDKDPNDRKVKEQLVRVETEIGGLDAGIAKARSFAKDDPDSSLYDVVSADLYERAGKRAEAVALLEKATAARPSDAGAAVALARLYSRAGDLGKAETMLKGRLKDRPDDALMRAALADFYISTKKFDPAIAEETRLLADRPNDVAALNNLAWLHQQLGDLSKAGRPADARAVLEKLLASGASFASKADAQKLLDELKRG